VLAEIESDKATMEFESFQDGVLLHIGVEKGKTAPVDSILAILGEKGEDISELLKEESDPLTPQGGNSDASSAEIEAKKEDPTDAEKTVSEQKSENKEDAKVAPIANRQSQIVNRQSSPSPLSEDGRVKASPLAKRMAEEKGIDISRVSGSGDGGRVVKRDVESHSTGGFVAGSTVERFTEEPVSQMRKTIAKRLSESKFTAPHFYLTMRIDMDEMMKARESINEVAPVKVSFNDLIIKACAVALKKHPKVNASWQGDTIRYNEHVHIGVAVAVPDGLLVPVVRFADTKRLSEISSEVKDFVLRANDRKLQPKDWEGNTFTVSNLGMFGIEEFTAIINTPDSCIMAIGGIDEVPVVRGGQIVPDHVMRVTLSCDHRTVDGASGAKFLQTFKQLMEHPVLLLGSYSI
jgi:pyruvate dehydrogenase E2 component (dihydrolipoamide acetyltransferase)